MNKEIVVKVPYDVMRKNMIETGKLSERHTCQLFYVTGRTFEPRGTGVLFMHEGRHFLISAGHVLKCLINNKKREEQRTLDVMVGIPNGEDLIMVSGKAEVDAGLDFMDLGLSPDIGIMELDKEVVTGLNGYYDFLTMENVAINHPGVKTMQYLINGYPKTTTKGVMVDEHTSIKAKALRLTTKIVPKPSMGELQKWQIPFTYDRKNAFDPASKETIDGPAAKGVSGSGVWFADIAAPEGTFDGYKLIGIATNHVEPYGNVIIATKIDVVTEALRQKFGLSIPKSKIVTVNLLA